MSPGQCYGRSTRRALGRLRVRQHPAWIEDPERIEGRLDGAHDADGVLAALRDQPFAPGRADAVFAGHAAAKVDGGLVEVHADGLGELMCPWVAALEDEIRVQVAVAGMPEGANSDAVPLPDRLDRPEHVRDPRTWHHDVLHVHITEALEGPVRGSTGLAMQPSTPSLSIKVCGSRIPCA